MIQIKSASIAAASDSSLARSFNSTSRLRTTDRSFILEPAQHAAHGLRRKAQVVRNIGTRHGQLKAVGRKTARLTEAAVTAIINQPQGAILAVGAIKERPVVRSGQLAIAHTMMVTLSSDHRILDGVTSGQFLTELKKLLENPVGLMV